MGFLDHSTNNIIIDAVLTDYGRLVLSQPKGAFAVAKFSFGDDEIDYTVIQKYGRAVGKEKIIKNTPIFEAQTRENLALKNRMITINDPTVVYLPSLTITTNVINGIVEIKTTDAAKEIQFQQSMSNASNAEIPDGLVDNAFIVVMSSRFLQLTNGSETVSPYSVDRGTRTAYYRVTANSTASTATARIGSVFLKPQPSLDDTTFNIYSNMDNKSKIPTVVSIIGESSGVRADFVVNITK